MITINIYQIIVVPFLVGILIPFITMWLTQIGLPEQVETIANIALSALAAAIPLVEFNASWPEFFTALAVAWIATMRPYVANWTTSQQVGRHAKDQDSS